MARAVRRSEGSADTRDALLEAAQRRCARFGPRKTTMGEVAREAGCSRATLYTHFPSKQALYSGLLERETRAFCDEVESVAASTGPAARKLARILEATVRIYGESPLLRGALTGDDDMSLERIAAPAVARHERQVVEVLSRLLRAGVEEGSFRELDEDAVAELMFELGRVLVTRRDGDPAGVPLERRLRVMSDLLAHGIARRPNARRPSPRKRA